MSTDNKAQETEPEDFFWQTYLDASKAEDEARPKNWEGNTTGILTFTGLFAATVAAFIVESYKLLSPDSGDRTNVLLEHLIIAMANVSSQNPVAAPPPEVFSVSSSFVVTNVCWLSSLLIALVCALLSTLVQEWSRNYIQDINRRNFLHESLRGRAFNHIYIRMGVNRYGMDQFVSWIVALVHLSVFLFACGLLIFLFPINHVVAGISTAILGSFIAIYCAASLIPLLDRSCPYRTPISYMLAFIYWLTLQLGSRSRLSESTSNFQGLITRQYTVAIDRRFLTDPRFQFAWECTYVHINSDTQNMFFKGLPSLIRYHENRKALLSHMCANSRLMFELYHFLHVSYEAMHRELSSSSIDSEIFELVAILSERMYAMEVEHLGEHIENSVLTSSWLLHVIGRVSQIADSVEGPSQLLARLCLVRVRLSLLEISWKAFKKGMPTLREEKVPDVFSKISKYNYQLGNRNPNTILLLLTAGSYTDDLQYTGGDEWQSMGWRRADQSTLLPLHDDACCRDGRNFALTFEGLAHVAACNILTAIAHVLVPTDSQRNHPNASSLDRICRKFGLWDDWEILFHILPNDEQKIPSSAFVSVLRSAGLDEWLEPGSTFDTKPRNGPNYDFLNHGTGRDCVVFLRDLAQNLDFEAYFDRARMQNSNSSAVPTILPHNAANVSAHARGIPSQTSSSSADGDEPGSTPDGLDASLTVVQQPSSHDITVRLYTGSQELKDARGMPGSTDDIETVEKDPIGDPTGLNVEPRETGQSEDTEAFDLRTVTIDQTSSVNIQSSNLDGEMTVNVAGGSDLEGNARDSSGPGEIDDDREHEH